MDKRCVLRCNNEYIRIPYIGGGSVHLTKNSANATHFMGETHALGTLKAVFSNPEFYMIDPQIIFDNITFEEIDADTI